jgi:hypothetical protein
VADKKITELQLVDEVDDSLNIPSDDGIQSYRATGLQFKNYIVPTAKQVVLASVTATGSVAAGTDFEVIDATSGAVTRTLPAASAISGRRIIFKKTDSGSNAVTIARAGSDTIDGGTSATIDFQYQSITLVSNGVSAWHRV